MSLWAIVPVKPLRRGKSRLAGVLSEDERALLNFAMLGNTLKTLKSVAEIEQILVVSRDPAALALAREHGARTIQEEGAPELNAALRRATAVAGIYAASGVLILPADLPLITSKDIKEFISNYDNPPEVIIAPDRRKDGTNALLVCPAGIIDYHYGPGSFNKHLDQVKKLGIRVKIVTSPTLELDLDLPEDLEMLKLKDVIQVDR
jgi:2-phospho-L-lactate guanylyltransferase